MTSEVIIQDNFVIFESKYMYVLWVLIEIALANSVDPDHIAIFRVV